jgi:hypothetical protein
VGSGDVLDQPTPESTERRGVKNEDNPFDLANLRLTPEAAAAMSRAAAAKQARAHGNNS